MGARRFLVTCAPPNPNGDLHLGHLSGPFLGADVLTRYLRQRGHDVLYVSYTDDFSPYVLRRAEELGIPPEETAFVFGRRMEETLSLARMLPDYYEHPFREPVHVETIHRFFRELWSRRAFTVGETPVFHCETCDRYLYEAHVRGRCQFCGEPSDGFYCEECALPQEPAGLREPFCIRCRREPSVRTGRRLIFPLARARERLAEYYAAAPWRPRLLDYCRRLVDDGLPDTPVSRISRYGVPVPLEGWDGHILDTWYSGIFGYVAATAAYGAARGRPDLWRDVWEGADTEIAHFIGFDCSFSHAVLWPAVLMAHGAMAVPRYVITNEFYRLEGEKFSTSRGHAIWGADFLREFDADAVRLYLCLTNPEDEQTSFTRDEFVANGGPRSRLDSWLDALFALAGEHDGFVPEAEGTAPPEAIRRLARELPEGVARALEPATFSLREAARSLASAVETASGAIVDARSPADVAAHVELAAVFAATAGPIMPSLAERVWERLGLPFASPVTKLLPWPDGRPLVAAGHRFAAAAPAALAAG